MTTTKNNEHKKLNFSSEREQSQVCLNSAEHEKNQGRKVLNVPNLRFPEFQGEWEEHLLGNISDVTKLAGFEFTKYVTYEDTGSIIAIRGLNCKNGSLDLRDVKYIDNSDFSKLSRSKLYVGDILYTYVGTVGEVAVVDKNDKYYLAPNVSRIRLSKDYNSDFIKQLLGSKKFYNKIVFPLIATSSQPALSMENLRRFKLRVPSIKEQNKIASLFNAIDERIATQNKIIEDLKRLKSAIIEKEYSNKTKNFSRLGDFIEQISKRNKDRAIHNVLSVSNSQGFIQQSEQFENRIVASDDTSNYKIVERNHFAFNPARINVGSIARLITFEKGIVSPMYICFRTKDSLFPEYLGYYFESKQFFIEIQKRLEGSVRQCLSFEGLCNIPLSIPMVEVQQQIGKRLSALVQKIKLETDFLELLQKQKKFLLQQMFI